MLQKRPEYFMGLGTGDEVPAVMQAEGKVGVGMVGMVIMAG